MVMHVQGVVRGKHIQLERETGLPSGSVVTIRIEPAPLTVEEKRRLIDQLCGVWERDASIPDIFAEIERRRGATVPREVNFDVAS